MQNISLHPMSRCGVICATDCHAFGAECEGCVALAGRVSWAAFLDRDDCPIYACAAGKGLSDCGQCGSAPCQLWYDTRNPDASDEEFAADITSRVANLRNLRKDRDG